jgi:hypothetical protein
METIDAKTAVLAGGIVVGGLAIGKAAVDHIVWSKQRTGTQPMEIYEPVGFGEELLKAAAAYTALALFIHEVGSWLK